MKDCLGIDLAAGDRVAYARAYGPCSGKQVVGTLEEVKGDLKFRDSNGKLRQFWLHENALVKLSPDAALS